MGYKDSRWRLRTRRNSVGRPSSQWTEATSKVVGTWWIGAAQDRLSWHSIRETYLQQCTSKGIWWWWNKNYFKHRLFECWLCVKILILFLFFYLRWNQGLYLFRYVLVGSSLNSNTISSIAHGSLCIINFKKNDEKILFFYINRTLRHSWADFFRFRSKFNYPYNFRKTKIPCES